MIAREVNAANQDLEEFERIKKYRIINRKFSEALGEVTPTLKTKKKAVVTNFAREIDSMYS